MQGLNKCSNQFISVLGAPYEYDKLPQGDFFRYLTLQPGIGGEPLECSLCTASLPQISFEAISYVWGEDVKNQEITCDGHIIKITENLHNVLQRLRLPDAPRKLWADGICINQDDVKEKGHQVAIMGQVYRSADRVLIYIGADEGGHAPQLCSLLEEVTEMIERQLSVLDSSMFPHPAPDDPLPFDTRWKSMYYLLQNEWFRRGWVVREAAFAKIGKVIWGCSEFLWEDFMGAHMWLANRAWVTLNVTEVRNRSVRLHTSAYAMKHRQFADALEIFGSLDTQDMLRVLNFAKYLEVSDPRDRVYAFMDLSDYDREKFAIVPDYGLSFIDVYRRFAIEYTRYIASPRVLDYICHPVGAEHRTVASWIPRWDFSIRSLPSKGLRKSILSSREGAVCTPVFVGDTTTMKTRGVVLDRVRYASVPMDSSTTSQILSMIWKDVKSHLDESYGSTRILDAFLDTLSLGGSHQGQRATWRSHRAAFAKHAKLSCGPHEDKNSLQEDTANNEREEMDLFFGPVKVFITGFKFVVTERGYMGLAPDLTEQGDSCGIIFGCWTPCILRPTGREQYYSFLGGAHITAKEPIQVGDDEVFLHILGEESRKEWVEWDVEEQDIYLV